MRIIGKVNGGPLSLRPAQAQDVSFGERLFRDMRTRWLSGRMSAAKFYAKPVEVGTTMVSGTVGEVVASRNPDSPSATS
jgi:N-terminal domain of oxidoreductase